MASQVDQTSLSTTADTFVEISLKSRTSKNNVAGQPEFQEGSKRPESSSKHHKGLKGQVEVMAAACSSSLAHLSAVPYKWRQTDPHPRSSAEALADAATVEAIMMQLEHHKSADAHGSSNAAVSRQHSASGSFSRVSLSGGLTDYSLPEPGIPGPRAMLQHVATLQWLHHPENEPPAAPEPTGIKWMLSACASKLKARCHAAAAVVSPTLAAPHSPACHTSSRSRSRGRDSSTESQNEGSSDEMGVDPCPWKISLPDYSAVSRTAAALARGSCRSISSNSGSSNCGSSSSSRTGRLSKLSRLSRLFSSSRRAASNASLSAAKVATIAAAAAAAAAVSSHTADELGVDPCPYRLTLHQPLAVPRSLSWLRNRSSRRLLEARTAAGAQSLTQTGPFAFLQSHQQEAAGIIQTDKRAAQAAYDKHSMLCSQYAALAQNTARGPHPVHGLHSSRPSDCSCLAAVGSRYSLAMDSSCSLGVRSSLGGVSDSGHVGGSM